MVDPRWRPFVNHDEMFSFADVIEKGYLYSYIHLLRLLSMGDVFQER